jgi:thiol-disulfide isomerase/thioredoxin
MTNLTRDTIDDFISTNQTVLIQFGAVWCQPCARIKKRMPDIQQGFDLIPIAYVDVDELQQHDRVKELKLMAVPTFVLYHKGKIVKSQPTSDENVIIGMLNDARKL